MYDESIEVTNAEEVRSPSPQSNDSMKEKPGPQDERKKNPPSRSTSLQKQNSKSEVGQMSFCGIVAPCPYDWTTRQDTRLSNLV